MAGRKKGTPKTGGRKKGTPNKTTSLAKEMMSQWLEAHNTIPKGESQPLIMQDFTNLDPRDRVKVTMECIKMLMPKNVVLDDRRDTIEDKLSLLAGENEDE